MTNNGGPQLGQDPIDVTDPAEGDLVLWSVTTIIGVLDKPALIYWAAAETARAAIAHRDSLEIRVAEDGEDETIKWLRDARFRRPKDRLSSADLGTVCHAAAEEYALSGTRPGPDRLDFLVRQKAGPKFAGARDEVAVLTQMLDRFDGWLQRFTPSYQATEVAVYSTNYGYAGTADAFLTIDGVRFIVDYKTSRESHDDRGNPKTPYPEQVALQLAAYRHAGLAAVWRPRRFEKWRRRYYLLSPDEQAVSQPVPTVDGGLCLHITPEACESWPIRADGEAFRAFLHAQEAFRWVNFTSRNAMGAPLQRPTVGVGS